MTPDDFRYRYDALVKEVYDGDTCYAEIDLGMHTHVHDQGLRLFEINTPELNRKATKAAGLLARDFLCATLVGCPVEEVATFERRKRRIVLPDGGAPVFLHTIKDDDGKYGRWLAKLYVQLGDELIDVTELMLSSGHAVPY